MGYVAQKRTRLSGRIFYRGEAVPDELGNNSLVGLGILAVTGPVGSTDAPGPDSTGGEGGGGYDPGEYTVAEVTDYATAHPDEVEAIGAAEAAGKARVTLLAALAELVTASDTTGGEGDGSPASDTTGGEGAQAPATPAGDAGGDQSENPEGDPAADGIEDPEGSDTTGGEGDSGGPEGGGA